MVTEAVKPMAGDVAGNDNGAVTDSRSLVDSLVASGALDPLFERIDGVFCQIEVVQNSVSVQSEKAAGFSPIERKTRRRCSSYPIRAWVRLYDSPSNLIILP